MNSGVLDVDAYLRDSREESGDDPYKRHAFNQAKSDSIPIDRNIPDTRNYR